VKQASYNFQNVRPRIDTAINSVIKWREVWFSLRLQPRIFEIMTLIARSRQHCWWCLAIYLIAEFPQKRGVKVHNNNYEAQWRLPEKKRVSTQAKSFFVMALRFSKRKSRSCAQTYISVSSIF